MSDIPSNAGGDDTDTTPTPLEQFQSSLPEGAASEWGQDVTDQINSFLATKTAALQNAQVGQRMVDDYNGLVESLSGWVRADPAATETAIGIGDTTALKLADDHPYLGEDQKEGVGRQLAQETAQKIGRAGIMALAGVDDDSAHALLDRLQSRNTFGSEDESHIRNYIDGKADARQADQAAQTLENQKYQKNVSTATLVDYANSLIDGKGNPRIPPGYHDSTFSNMNLSPADTLIAKRLADQATGDQPLVTPSTTIRDFLSNLQKGNATTQDALQLAISGDARMQDAALLAKLSRNPEDAQRFAQVLDTAKASVLGADGANATPAGQNKLNQLAHNLLLKYNDQGSLAFDGLPGNPMVKGGLGETFAQRAESDLKLEAIFSKARATSVAQARLADEREQARAEARQREAERAAREERRAAQAYDERQAAIQRADRQRAQDRAERQAEREQARQERAQEAAARAQEREDARRAAAARQSAPAGPTPLQEFRRGYSAVRRAP